MSELVISSIFISALLKLDLLITEIRDILKVLVSVAILLDAYYAHTQFNDVQLTPKSMSNFPLQLWH